MTAQRTLVETLAHRLIAEHPLEAAQLLESQSSQLSAQTLAAVDAQQAAMTLARMDTASAAASLSCCAVPQRTALIASIAPSLAARLLRALGATERAALLAECEPQVRRPIERLLAYPENTAGALMEPSPLAMSSDVPAAEARRRLQTWPGQEAYLYVTQRDDVLAGVIGLRDLLRADDQATLASLARTPVARLSARADAAAIVAHDGWRRYHRLPVVDRAEVLIGSIGHRTLHAVRGSLGDGSPDAPLGLAIGELYWTMMSRVLDGVMQAVTPLPHATEEGGQRG